jgi:hypothetical protein
MKKRTQKKDNTLRKKRSLRKKNKPLKNTKKRSVKKRTSKRSNRKVNKKTKQSGGGDNELTTLLDVLLSKDVISFIPTSQIFDYKKIDRYIRMVDVATLKDIVLENIELKKSPTIQRIFNYTSEELKDPKKITFKPEDVNCETLIGERNQFVKKLFLYLFECNENTYIKKDVNWFRIVCGLDEFDDTFEYNCMKQLIKMGIFLKKSEIIEKIKLLEEDFDFKLILKRRLYNCCEKPRTFFESIFGGISFPSFNDCDKKSPEGILYLYDEYKRFLMKDHEGLTKLDKVKVLIFCETRQHLLSKHIALELVRINDKNYTHIRYLLKKIFNLDHDLIKENDKQLIEIQKEKDREKAKQLNLQNNLEKIDDKYKDEPKELTEEEKMIQELEEQRKKSLTEGDKFKAYSDDIENRVQKSDEDKEDEKKVGGAYNESSEPEPDISSPSPAVVEPLDPAVVEPLDPAVVEPLDPAVVEPLDPAVVEPLAPAPAPAPAPDANLDATPPPKDETSTFESSGQEPIIINESNSGTSDLTDSGTTDFDSTDFDSTDFEISDLDGTDLTTEDTEIKDDKDDEDKKDIKEEEIQDAVQAQQDVKDCDALNKRISLRNELTREDLEYFKRCERVGMDPFRRQLPDI